MINSTFFAKILLFGEYLIVYGNEGLIIPYNLFGGKLVIPKEEDYDIISNNYLVSYYGFLKKNKFFKNKIDLNNLKLNLKNKLFFESNIPIGYGIGSSGAVVSAIYSKYALNKISRADNNKDSLVELKEIFSIMEGFFHGKSSGLDPLNSYLNSPILVQKNNIKKITIPKQDKFKSGGIFLVDSGKIKITELMIGSFIKKMDEKSFQNAIQNKMVNVNQKCIQFFLESNIESLIDNVKELSIMTFEYLKKMIPKDFYNLWLMGIEQNLYYLKLCGSGGGGYIIGFTKNLNEVEKFFGNKKIEIVFKF